MLGRGRQPVGRRHDGDRGRGRARRERRAAGGSALVRAMVNRRDAVGSDRWILVEVVAVGVLHPALVPRQDGGRLQLAPAGDGERGRYPHRWGRVDAPGSQVRHAGIITSGVAWTYHGRYATLAQFSLSLLGMPRLRTM